MEEKELLFIAQMINTREALNNGYSMPFRWLCLRQDLQEKYLNEARQVVNDWWGDELDARSKRKVNRRKHTIKA